MKEYSETERKIAFHEAHNALKSFTLNKFGDYYEDKFTWDTWYPFNLDALSKDISPTLSDIRRLIYIQGGEYFVLVSSATRYYNRPSIHLLGQRPDGDWQKQVAVFTEYGQIHVDSCLGDSEDRFEKLETAVLHNASVHFTPRLTPNTRLDLVRSVITAVDLSMQQFVFTPQRTALYEMANT